MFRHAMYFILAVSCRVICADDWGSVDGQIVVDGEIPARQFLFPVDAEVKDREICAGAGRAADDLQIDDSSRGLANVFVYLSSSPAQIHPDFRAGLEKPVTLRSRECRFVPHCLICRTRQSIEFHNDDAVAHHANPYPLKNAKRGYLIPPAGSPIRFSFEQPESSPVRIGCDYHPWMSGYLLVVDHPYAAITDAEGRFHIRDLPEGDHEFCIWHERSGYLHRTFRVTVVGGESISLQPLMVSVERLGTRDTSGGARK